MDRGMVISKGKPNKLGDKPAPFHLDYHVKWSWIESEAPEWSESSDSPSCGTSDGLFAAVVQLLGRLPVLEVKVPLDRLIIPNGSSAQHPLS
jgi:hypothetical protein